ncbi:MAG: hypothetical protein EAZ78_10165 [Oscillatoriales cyanobacterium]|uniref:Uncharacterized protein n=1 Tax=Microcoleus anatoxicus PTRS2 TaxID=2705321 RepID=A0ABU8YXE2_9CYAN|nr:MAG: hypothetical protein EA000_01305 [Oscillatoriales cyanobacterium]TAF04124.1 MAG: hypothetical protein EAZ78_10165 [Oscillatoriales cyanobacterium]TAF70825.1 MAG: hypothetical protein EAZ59_03270 [Oscillatoriales cyanobacterium]
MGIAHLTATKRNYKNAIAQLNQEEPLIKFIGQVELRNSHRVYYQQDSYRVEQINPKKTYSYDIPDKAVEYLYNKLKGRKVTPKDASTVFNPVAKNFNLPFTYGHQLDFYAQEVLVVLVALGQASLSKEGRAYFYIIA